MTTTSKQKKIPTVGRRASVLHGHAKHTSGGLTKADLTHNKAGCIVSKKNSARAKRTESPLMQLWRQSVAKMYENPKYSGRFVPIKKGTAFYNDINREYHRLLEEKGYVYEEKPSTSKRR